MISTWKKWLMSLSSWFTFHYWKSKLNFELITQWKLWNTISICLVCLSLHNTCRKLYFEFLTMFFSSSFFVVAPNAGFLAFPSTTVICSLHSVEGALVRSCEDLNWVSYKNVFIWYVGSVSKPLVLSTFSLIFLGGFILPFFSPSASLLVYLHHGASYLSSTSFGHS